MQHGYKAKHSLPFFIFFDLVVIFSNFSNSSLFSPSSFIFWKFSLFYFSESQSLPINKTKKIFNHPFIKVGITILLNVMQCTCVHSTLPIILVQYTPQKMSQLSPDVFSPSQKLSLCSHTLSLNTWASIDTRAPIPLSTIPSHMYVPHFPIYRCRCLLSSLSSALQLSLWPSTLQFQLFFVPKLT